MQYLEFNNSLYVMQNFMFKSCQDALPHFKFSFHLVEWAIALHGMYESALFFVLILK